MSTALQLPRAASSISSGVRPSLPCRSTVICVPCRFVTTTVPSSFAVRLKLRFASMLGRLQTHGRGRPISCATLTRPAGRDARGDPDGDGARVDDGAAAVPGRASGDARELAGSAVQPLGVPAHRGADPHGPDRAGWSGVAAAGGASGPLGDLDPRRWRTDAAPDLPRTDLHGRD